MSKFPSYSVTIRTLGTAGDKYLRQLKSLQRQTVKPDGIFVYITDGYSISGIEMEGIEYLKCETGMGHTAFAHLMSKFLRNLYCFCLMIWSWLKMASNSNTVVPYQMI